MVLNDMLRERKALAKSREVRFLNIATPSDACERFWVDDGLPFCNPIREGLPTIHREFGICVKKALRQGDFCESLFRTTYLEMTFDHRMYNPFAH